MVNEHTRFLCKAARKRGVKCVVLKDENFCVLSKGTKLFTVYGGVVVDGASAAGFMLARRKGAAHQILKANGFPVLPQITTDDVAVARAFMERQKRVVVKPLAMKKGKGISVDISNNNELKKAWAIAGSAKVKKIVEKYYGGVDHRLLVIGYKKVYAIQRFPAFVVGDGRHSIKQLIKLKNSAINAKVRRKEIVFDDALRLFLSKNGQKLQDVPGAGERVIVRGTANLHTGGETRDVTDEISVTVKKEAIAVARLFQLPVAGVDYLAQDINKKRYIIEVNEDPGIQLHHFPGEGVAREPVEDILDMLFGKK